MDKVYNSHDVSKVLENKGYEFEITNEYTQFSHYKYFVCNIRFVNNIKPLIPEHFYNKFKIYVHKESIIIAKKLTCEVNEFWELAMYMARSLPINPFKSINKSTPTIN